MDNIYYDDEEIANVIDGIEAGDEDQPVMISEPETTEVVPAVEPNPVDIPVVPEIAPPMQDIPVPAPEGEIPQTPCCNGHCEETVIGVSQFFGTLMESVKIAWQYHLKSKKHSEHVVLEEYYDDAQELIDSLIEEYQGMNGVIENYENCVCGCEKTPVVYFQELRCFIVTNRDSAGVSSEIQSDIDSILSKIDSTLYKLTNLVESKKPFMYFEEFEKINR